MCRPVFSRDGCDLQQLTTPKNKAPRSFQRQPAHRWVFGEWVAEASSVKSRTSVCEASDWHLTNVTVRPLFALPCTSEKPGRGILSLSGITLWTTCSSGALSSSVVTNNAAGRSLCSGRVVSWLYVGEGARVCVFSCIFCVCLPPLIFPSDGAWSWAQSSSSVSHWS